MYSNATRLTNWLAVLSFIVLIAFSLIGIASWRLHNPAFVSIHTTNQSNFLHTGDAVVTQQVKLTDLQPGDIISYYNPQDTQQAFTQRLAQIDQASHTFTPVNTDKKRLTQPIDASLLIGKVQYHIAKFGYVLDFTQSRIGLVVAVYLPALFIVGQELKLLAIAFDRPTYRLLIPPRRTE